MVSGCRPRAARILPRMLSLRSWFALSPEGRYARQCIAAVLSQSRVTLGMSREFWVRPEKVIAIAGPARPA